MLMLCHNFIQRPVSIEPQGELESNLEICRTDTEIEALDSNAEQSDMTHERCFLRHVSMKCHATYSKNNMQARRQPGP